MHIKVEITTDEAAAYARESLLRSMEHKHDDTFDVVVTPREPRSYNKIAAIKLLRDQIRNCGLGRSVGFQEQQTSTGRTIDLVDAKRFIEALATLILG